jgi:DNA-directed RNA polymerase subunit RPC12/RpoP
LTRPAYNAENIAVVLKSFLLQPSVLSIGETKSEEVKQQNFTSVQADQTYTHTQHFLYLCMQCGETVTNMGSVISHQVTAAHPNIGYQCEQCSAVYYSKALYD